MEYKKDMDDTTDAVSSGVIYGGMLGLLIGFGSGAYVLKEKCELREQVGARDDIVLTDALSQELAKTLLQKGYVSQPQLEAAAAKGVQTMVEAANAAFSAADTAKEQARAAVDAYLADPSKTPVVKLPAAPAP